MHVCVCDYVCLSLFVSSPQENSKASRKNKRQAQLLKYTAAAAQMCGDEPDESTMPAKDSEVRVSLFPIKPHTLSLFHIFWCHDPQHVPPLFVCLQLVPTRDMVKHKARILLQRQKQRKAVKDDE